MRPYFYTFAFVLISTSATFGAEPVDYLRQVKPVLQARCYACHGVLKQKAGLRLDTVSLAIKGSKIEPSVLPGDAEASPLFDRISSTEDSFRMPPEGEPLKPGEIAAIRTWIQDGAKAPSNDLPERDPRDHWAFKAPIRPAVPKVKNKAWSQNPIDAFVAIEHEKRGLRPQASADKRIWLRRVTLDLIGLPPTIQEVETFVADTSHDAYDKVVDRLLASPQYGERWGRHFMDIWRYSDWWGLGADLRNSQKHIWRWRDWIVESLNANKPYSQMLKEMLAADELYPDDQDRLRATGFLARQYFKFNRTTWLDETIEHTSKSMLGLTFNCAKCHDHKYDPISQLDYYKFRSVFEPYQVRTDAVPGEIDPEKDGLPRPFDCNLDTKTYLHIRGDDRRPDTTRELSPAVPAFLSGTPLKPAPIKLPPEAYQPGLRTYVLEGHLKQAEANITKAKTQIKVAKQALAVAAKPEEKLPESSEKRGPSKILVKEDFASSKPTLWEIRGGKWDYKDGHLTQSQTGATRSSLRLRTTPPANFEIQFQYIPTGGDLWKSVGIVFDAAETTGTLAYLSSVAGNSKAQVSYKKGGADVYPDDSAQARTVELGKSHELILRVRGQLVNLLVDGEESVAYRLPIKRKPGPIELITFDAKATFQAFELRELPADLVLKDPKKGSPPSIPEAQAAVVLAEKSLITSEAEITSIKARHTADRAKYLDPSNKDLNTLLTIAAKSDRRVKLAKADEEMTRAELQLLQAAKAKKPELEKTFATAKTAFEAAKKAIENPGTTYPSLIGATKSLESPTETAEHRALPFPATSTGRRTALAHWITDKLNPLTTRVAVNHLWSRHFGRALVPTVFDFGRKGIQPTHQELLDWLAVEFMDHGWSMKHIHRLITTSQTYRLASTTANATSANLVNDRDNKYYWHANPIRVEAQVVRDSLLSLSGELDLTRGGPSIPVSDENSKRRSLYFVHSHNEHQKFLSIFDDASVLECYRRSESVLPQQALALENSPLAAHAAEKIAHRLLAENPRASDRDFLKSAYAMILVTQPTDQELTVLEDALKRLTQLSRESKRAKPEDQAKTSIILALLNHNDFITIR